MFGKSKEDTSQDENIKNVWQWVNYLESERKIFLEWLEYFKKRDKLFAQCIAELQAKDKQHDLRDAEHDKLLEALKSIPAALAETPT